MRINLAHIRVPSTTGTPIDFAVIDAKSNSGLNSDNATLLVQLTTKGRASGLKIDQSALAFMENGRLKFYGTRNLVEHLSNGGLLRWTRHIDI